MYNGIETWTFLGLEFGKLCQTTLKSNSLEEFKLKIKLWNLENCPCMFCKTFLSEVVFL